MDGDVQVVRRGKRGNREALVIIEEYGEKGKGNDGMVGKGRGKKDTEMVNDGEEGEEKREDHEGWW